MRNQDKILFAVVFVGLVAFISFTKPSFVGNAVIKNTCSDSDGGKMILAQGTVSGLLNKKPYSFVDTCFDSKTLKEYYCGGSVASYYNAGCGINGYSSNYCKDGSVYQDFIEKSCSAGACVQTTTLHLVTTCDYGCDAGVCNIIPPVADICADSDGGNVISVRGYASGYLNTAFYNNSDYCVDGLTIFEYSCSGSSLQSSQLSCGADFYSAKYCKGASVYQDFNHFSCSLGACQKQVSPLLLENCPLGCVAGACFVPPDSCNDTDRGFVITVKGSVSGYFQGTHYSYPDYCYTGTDLNEYICQGTTPVGLQVPCMNNTRQCLNGACV
ncbi:MAG: hypothetical protein V1837_01270 [Candidatus Woesearchaeota archaeon]